MLQVQHELKKVAPRGIPLPSLPTAVLNTVKRAIPLSLPDIVPWMQMASTYKRQSVEFQKTAPLGVTVLNSTGDGYEPGLNLGDYEIWGQKINIPQVVTKNGNRLGKVPVGGKAWMDNMNLLAFYLNNDTNVQMTNLLLWFKNLPMLGMGGWGGNWEIPTFAGNMVPKEGLAASGLFSYNSLPFPTQLVAYDITTQDKFKNEVTTIIREPSGTLIGKDVVPLEGSLDYTVLSTFIGGMPSAGIIEVFPSKMKNGCTLSTMQLFPPPF